jgi:hypothetical protein
MLARNVGEEMVEAAIRKGTGQEYGPTDFLAGILMGGAFEGIFAKQLKNWQVDSKRLTEANKALEYAEEVKGGRLTEDEMIATIMPMKANDQKTFQELFDRGLKLTEKRLAYKTGEKEAQPGITEPAPLPDVKTRVPTLAKKIETKAIEKKLTESLGELPEVEVKKIAPQIEAAKKMIETDYDRAVRIAMGQEKPPEGIHPETFLKTVEDVALKAGDVDTIENLAESSRLVSEATTMGSRLRMLRERDPYSPVSAVEKNLKDREKMAVREGIGDTEYARQFDIMTGEIKDLKAQVRKLKAKEAQKIEKGVDAEVAKDKKASFKRTPKNKEDWASFSKQFAAEIACP